MIIGSAVVGSIVVLIGSAVVGLIVVLIGSAVVGSVGQSLTAKEFGMGIATKFMRLNLNVVSDFVHLHVFMSPVQCNL